MTTFHHSWVRNACLVGVVAAIAGCALPSAQDAPVPAEQYRALIANPIRTERDGDEMEPCEIAGPTCDSADVLYENNHYPKPMYQTNGDEVLIEGTGAYTTTYSAVAFNCF